MTDAMTQRLEGPAPVMEIALDLAKRATYIAPVMIVLGAVFWQTEGAFSVAYALAIVIVNFLMAAGMLAYAGRISFAAMGGAAMFGFLIRLGLIFLAVLLVKDQSWVKMVPLGLTLIVAHLALLFWETRYVSATMAHPGLKPSARLPIHQAASSNETSNETTGSSPK